MSNYCKEKLVPRFDGMTHVLVSHCKVDAMLPLKAPKLDVIGRHGIYAEV
jgi:hypothetical protein